ncbi:hypothetical protein QA584_16520 [Anaerocolumna sp. AGMB13025]|uniref:hypothetical protein n=1 Tax=Anaerocolumna sp. AGMB13025 TaxID=3039116 RepID=UPI00241DD8A9|nr:hypothetical protein [Anaerocolumna sp. AGMB13025]WFR55207.1 hypothetical protein QA584_16520 [Anaerocolumna sp. AGMB13025]
MKKFKKFMSLSLALYLCLFIGNTVYASQIPSNNSTLAISNNTIILNEVSKFKTMSNAELNKYIDDMKILSEEKNSKSADLVNVSSAVVSATLSGAADPIQLAWLAGAQILKNKGYTCAGELLEDSVNNINYNENALNANGLFSSKIVTTTAYKNYIAKIKANQTQAGIEFPSNQNYDLFLALHNTDASTAVTMPGTIFAIYNVTISDTYDFSPASYDSIFVSAINNWAWLSQQVGSLHSISIKITFLG